MANVKITNSLHDILRDDWNSCFAGEPEAYDYLLAVEDSGIKGFEWRYLTAWDGNILLAAMPAYLNDYALDTTLQGAGKKITGAIRAALPRLLTVKLACLGSPCTEAGIIGFNTQVSEVEKPDLIKLMVTGFEEYAASNNCKLIGLKDIPENMSGIWQPAINEHKFASLPGMPTAYLDIDFATTEEYITRLSYKMRKNMRQKLKSLSAVRIEESVDINTLLPQIMQLYTDTRGRSEWQYEELTENYFKNILANMPDKAFCVLYYAEEKLLAVNLLIRDGENLLDKFFCMNSEIGREYNLYFISWFHNISYCLKNGIKRYLSGQANYESKVRLGSKLIRNSMYFKHRNILAQGVLKLVAPFLSADETIKEAA